MKISSLSKTSKKLLQTNSRCFSTCLNNKASLIGSPSEIPLSSFFPGTPVLPNQADSSEESLVFQTQKSTLPNGLNVVSTDSTSRGVSVVSLFVNAGSRFETYRTSGVSHFVEKFFFSGTNNRSLLRLVTELQKTGATVSAQAGRENIVYQTEALRESVPQVLELISNSVLQGRLHPWDLEPKTEAVKRDISEFQNNPQFVLNEALHNIAFNGETLGRSLLCPPHNVSKIDTDVILSYMDNLFVAPRMTLVGTNISHDELKELAAALFGSIPTQVSQRPEGELFTFDKSEYVGGDYQIHDLSGNGVHAILAYKGPSLNSTTQAPYLVLNEFLGQTSNKYTASIHHTASRLAKTVKNVEFGSSFVTSYSDNGLFGVYLSGKSAKEVSQAVEKVVSELNSVDKNLTQDAFEGAKNHALLKLYNSVSSSLGLNEHNATYGSVQEVAQAISNITLQEVQQAAKTLLQSKPTLVSYGNLDRMIKVRNIQ
ncbi:hypothetical protein C9374_005744 [Naegleria lovaniensis]|uniref:Cytochrome b-c1 complex subunit 2, mitochondrial n=1 Tax=Naegleria lovaniensis TaxID=51637 RepID=A0AA88GPE0_NAELO|nr:uncharacterized protein C9374_005744 [Naegleria lovaniensis]KAG2381952.1 hypothetical protein C9374_005744 [Naegleria lovaniensis]